MLTDVLTLLWQGASSRDLSRWLARRFADRYRIEADEVEWEGLADRLIRVYERSLFDEDSKSEG